MTKYTIAMYIAATIGAVLITFGIANAAIYCYPQGMNTTCFTDDGRTFTNNNSHVRNPNVTIVPQYHPYMPAWIYTPQAQPRREVPEQDFGECTLALGCIKGTR